MDFKKIFSKKNIIRGVTGLLCFGVAFTGVYLVTSGSKEKAKDPETYFEKFTSKMMKVIDGSSEGDGFNTKASIQSLKIESDSFNAEINGELALGMESLEDLEFTADITANVDDTETNVAFGIAEDNIYLVFNDTRLKASYTNVKSAVSNLLDSVGQLIDLDIGDLDLSGLLGDLDIDSLRPSEEVGKKYAVVTLDTEDIELKLNILKSDLTLRHLEITRISIGDVEVSGTVDFESIDKVIGFENPTYPKRMGEFTDVLPYFDWVDNTVNLFKSNKLGFDLVTTITDTEDESFVANIDSSLNINLADVFDFNNLNIGGSPANLEISADITAKDENDVVIGNGNLSYFDNAGYLTILGEDQSYTKSKLETSEVTRVIGKIGDLISQFSENTRTKKAVDSGELEDALNTIGDFLYSIGIEDIIGNLDFPSIEDIVKNIVFEAGYMSVTLDLSSLNLGENLEISLLLNSEEQDAEKVSEFQINNLIVSGMNVSTSFTTHTFTDAVIQEIRNHKDEYEDIDLLLLDLLIGTFRTDFAKLNINLNAVVTLTAEVYVRIKKGNVELFVNIPRLPLGGDAKIYFDTESNRVHITKTRTVFFSQITDYYLADADYFMENMTDYLLSVLGLSFLEDIINSFGGTTKAISKAEEPETTGLDLNTILAALLNPTHKVDDKGNHEWDISLDLSSLTDGALTALNIVTKAKEMGENEGYFTEIGISTSISIISIKATIGFDHETTVWPESTITAVKVYDTLTDEQKAIFDTEYLNQIDKAYN